MKIDGLDWMDWLHKLRSERERVRQEKGISDEDELKQSFARGRRVMAEVRRRETPPVARDKPKSDD
ncbi:hypothetical protein FJY69_09605 [candidate division WOR-3 bacterium]|nr:hypothetical protein [candidate division WOR-3 bacterium]